MLSYGLLTIDFGIVVFAKTRWLFSYGFTFPPDARGDMLLYSNVFSAAKLANFTSVGRIKQHVSTSISKARVSVEWVFGGNCLILSIC